VIFPGTTPLWEGPGGCPAARVDERATQEKFDLGVSAAQLIRGPPSQGIVDGRVQPEEDALAFGHE
jgi:hypothetical protein